MTAPDGGAGHRHVDVEIPPRVEFVGLVRQLVADLGAGADGLGADRLFDLKVAVSEACTNAIEAQRDAGVDDVIGVSCDLDRDCLRVRVADHAGGLGRDARTAPLPANGSRVPERGRGLPLMRLLVDEVTFDGGADGTTVEMVVRLHQ